MATLADLARHQTGLGRDQIAHLQRLVGDWGMVADFCFSDLLLLAPTEPGTWLVLGQIRPTTSQTLYHGDWVGESLCDAERPVVAEAWRTGEIVSAELPLERLPEGQSVASGPVGRERVRVMAIPVRHGPELCGVVTREWSPTVGRQPGELERTYLEIFGRFARMITEGSFPYEAERSSTAAVPRVGDGVMLLDAGERVEYASPNAVSALHRLGVKANTVGLRLGTLGVDDHPIRVAFDSGQPVTAEIEHDAEVTVLLRCLPLSKQARVNGGVVLVRDISEVRRRDRMLLSKDATIREIHHRVKNNLQTISSLLRLQGRRLGSPEAKAAVEESVRRIRTIALVHDTLSREAGEEVEFTEILRPLARMVEEGLQSPERPVRFLVLGEAGRLPAMVATPLAVVLTELLQNAVDHAFGDGEGGTVAVVLASDGDELLVRVVDDGAGLPPGFSLDQADGLGLSIVRTLVTSELGGTIELRDATPADFPEGIVPARPGHGTVVELRMPGREVFA